MSLANAYGAGRCYTAVPVEKPGGEARRQVEPLCRLLERNLNTFCDRPPMVCGIKVAPEFASILRQPNWTLVRADRPLELAETLVHAWRPAPEVWEEVRPRLSEAARQGRLSVTTAEFDLLNIRRPLRVYRIDDNACAVENRPLLEDPNLWNEFFMQSQVRVGPDVGTRESVSKEYQVLGLGASAEVIFYGGETYLYGFVSLGPTSGPAGPTNVIFVDKPTQGARRASQKPLLLSENYCQIIYRKPETEQ